MHRGYIRFWRSSFDNPMYFADTFTRWQAWMDLLALTNHTDGYIRLRNGKRVDVKRGQCGWSEDSLAKRWRWSKGKVRRFKNELENDTQIVIEKNLNLGFITIINYDKYQPNSKGDSKGGQNVNLNGLPISESGENNDKYQKICSKKMLENGLENGTETVTEKKVDLGLCSEDTRDGLLRNGNGDSKGDSKGDGLETVKETDTNNNVNNVKNDKEYIPASPDLHLGVLLEFNQLTGKRYRMTPDKRKQINERLKVFSREDISRAINNRLNDPSSMGKNETGKIWAHDWDSLFRNDKNFDRALNLSGSTLKDDAFYQREMASLGLVVFKGKHGTGLAMKFASFSKI